MQGSRYRGLSLLVFVLLAVAGSAHATINMTGRWVLILMDISATAQPVNFQQIGSTLTWFPLTGTIDSTTGAFTLSDNAPCEPPTSTGPTTLRGTVAPDGLTFTGAYSTGVGPLCNPFTSPVNGWRSPATCGNGVVDPGEQCDDGTNLPGGCCDPGCRFFVKGTPCGSPNICINTEACDGAGTCVPGPPIVCDQCSRCDTTAATCVPAPATTCRPPAVAGAAQLKLESGCGAVFCNAKHRSMSWKWQKGQATTLADFGDPVHTDAYTLCMYEGPEGTPGTFFQATVPPGTGWQLTGTNGFKYTDKLGTAAGVTGISLKAGTAGKASIKVMGKGSQLQLLPSVKLTLPVTVQLRGHGECWGAEYAPAGVNKNTMTTFRGESAP